MKCDRRELWFWFRAALVVAVVGRMIVAEVWY